MVQVLLGRSGTQEDMELMPQTRIVEIEGPTNPEDAILQGAQLHSVERLDNGVKVGNNGVKVGGAGWTGTQICSGPPHVLMMKSKLPKHMSAPGAHPLMWLAIRSLERSTRRAKSPTWRANY
jgi:hypothetical protein